MIDIFNALFIEPTDQCNLSCHACGRNREGKSLMSTQTFRQILDKLGKRNERVSLFWQGEPTLHPDLPKMLNIAKIKGKRTYVSTNMTTKVLHNRKYVKELLKNLNKLELCIDGYDQKTLEHYRKGANFNTMLKNLWTLGDVDVRCVKEMRVLMFGHNDGKEYFFRTMAKAAGVDKLIFAAPIILGKQTISNAEADEWLSTNPIYQRYERAETGWVHKTRSRLDCTPSIIIDTHGFVYPCCYDWKKKHTLGHILHNTLAEIEYRYHEFVSQMKEGSVEFCHRDCFLPKLGGNVINHEEDLE
ncbi:MAG: radical SAM/SPASM domain-containing protein [Candidatus Thorarchaeota archaeon]|jgi:MoaA/NifB/PqqE/SkfB family radical SAM enzyme